MKRPTIDGGFWFSFGLNLIMNYEGAIAFVVLIICHFVFSIPLWIPLLVLGLWVGGVFLVTLVLSFIIKDAPSNASGNGTRNTTTHFASRGDGKKFMEERDSEE